jgi:uncharacterized membrane protein YfcA
LLDPISTILVLVGVGVGAGALGSVLGVGGGIIMVPALTFMGLPPAHVASTSLFAVTSTSVSSTIEYSRQKRIDYRLGIQLAALAIPGAVIGAFLSDYLTEGSFKLAFGILLILTGLYILYRNSILKEGEERTVKRSLHLMAAVFAATFGAGVISSVFGVGGGTIFVPVMLLVLGMTMHRAAPTSQFTLMITSVAGVLTHSFLGHPDYLQALVLSAGAFVGAQLGARLLKSAKDALLQRLLGIVLIGVAVKFILDWFSSR